MYLHGEPNSDKVEEITQSCQKMSLIEEIEESLTSLARVRNHD